MPTLRISRYHYHRGSLNTDYQNREKSYCGGDDLGEDGRPSEARLHPVEEFQQYQHSSLERLIAHECVLVCEPSSTAWRIQPWVDFRRPWIARTTPRPEETAPDSCLFEIDHDASCTYQSELTASCNLPWHRASSLRHERCISLPAQQPCYMPPHRIAFLQDRGCCIVRPFSHSCRSLHACIACAWLRGKCRVHLGRLGCHNLQLCTCDGHACSFHPAPTCFFHQRVHPR